MLDKCFGIISLKKNGEDFGVLSKPRPAYMLPFGGRYRLVDFMLSNMVNHGIDTVAVYTGKKVRSAMDHIGDGKPWELNRRISGLHIFPPQHYGSTLNEGDINQYYLTDDFFQEIKEENVYMITSNVLAKVDLSEAYKQFLESEADVLLTYTKVKNDPKYLNSEEVIFDDNGNFTNLGINLGSHKEINLYLGGVFMKKTVLRQLVREAKEVGEVRYLRSAFLKNKDNFKVVTYKHSGHIEDIKDTENYYKANMNLLHGKVSKEVFFKGGAVYTQSKDEPPTLYTDDSNVENSLIANGCVIEGTVKNSIIFRGVKVKKGAIIKDSIIMQKSTIEEDAYIVKSVLDKRVLVEAGVTIVGTKTNPYTVEKMTTVRKEK